MKALLRSSVILAKNRAFCSLVISRSHTHNFHAKAGSVFTSNNAMQTMFRPKILYENFPFNS